MQAPLPSILWFGGSCLSTVVLTTSVISVVKVWMKPRGKGWGTPYNGLYGEAPPKRGTFFRLEGYKRIGISIVEV